MSKNTTNGKSNQPKTFGEITGHTPLFDHIIDAVKIDNEGKKDKQSPHITALVYGCVWRRCQGTRGLFYEKNKATAEYLGVSKKSIARALDALEDWGYIFKAEMLHPK